MRGHQGVSAWWLEHHKQRGERYEMELGVRQEPLGEAAMGTGRELEFYLKVMGAQLAVNTSSMIA